MTALRIGDNGRQMVLRTATFVLDQLDRHRRNCEDQSSCPPLFVGVQGPQGAGKSHLTSLLPAYLEEHHGLRLATTSLDDFYLPRQALVELGQRFPDNRLLDGRGPAGTHDIPLLSQCIEDLFRINDSASSAPVGLPVYDKSQHGGQGDRAGETVEIKGHVDIVIFEGWMNGFASLSDKELVTRYQLAQKDSVAPSMLSHPLKSLQEINLNLRLYEDPVWGRINCFVQIKPIELGYVWTWRLQQEHNMKAKNGGLGMSDEEVHQFIDRYMPSYELFAGGIESMSAPWRGKALRFIVDIRREIVDSVPF